MEEANAEIRPYQLSDKGTLVHLFDLNSPNYFASDEKADFQKYLDNAIELYFVISLGDKIIGCGGINFSVDKTIGVLSWDLIHPEFQGKSFGKKLLEYRLTVLLNTPNIKKIIVRTSQITHLFYKKQGFQLKEIQVDYWAKGFDLYHMEFQIT